MRKKKSATIDLEASKEERMKTLNNKKGQGMIEYLMIAAFVVGLAVFLYQKVKEPAQSNINSIATEMGNAGK
jgi:hypothetical protein